MSQLYTSRINRTLFNTFNCIGVFCILPGNIQVSQMLPGYIGVRYILLGYIGVRYILLGCTKESVVEL